jgi:hypothetical protein
MFVLDFGCGQSRRARAAVHAEVSRFDLEPCGDEFLHSVLSVAIWCINESDHREKTSCHEYLVA